MMPISHLPPQSRTKVYFKRLIWKVLSLVPRETTLRTHNGILTFNSRDKVIGKTLFSTGNYEWNTIVSVMDVLREHSLYRGNIMLDVGANIGMIAIAFVKHGLYERALAFEPESYNFNLLRRNVSRNQLSSRIECHNFALSSLTGTLDLEIAKDNFGDHRLRPGGNFAPGFYHEEKRAFRPVKTMKLDDFLDGNPAVKDIGLVWIDIQGHEGHFLSGAKNTIRNRIPVVMEFWPYAMNRAGTSRETFLELIRELFTGYFHIKSCRPEWAPIETFHHIFDQYRRPREMGTVLFI